jgi:hypothetical protein
MKDRKLLSKLRLGTLFLQATAILILAATLDLAGARGAYPPGGSEIKPEKETPAERIRRVLEIQISFDLPQNSLSEMIRLIHEQTDLNFVLDRLTLQQMGINADEAQVTTKLKTKVGSGLRRILSQYSLSYVIIGDMVLITSEEMAIQRQMRQRVSVRFENLQLNAALRQLARETATNLVIDARVSKKALKPVTVTLDEVPLETAVKLLANLAGLKPVRVGNVLYVTTKSNVAELRADPESMPPAIRNPGGINEWDDVISALGIFNANPAPPPVAAPVAPPPVPAPAPADNKEQKKEEKGEEKPMEKKKEG